jgi:hypothetical protein
LWGNRIQRKGAKAQRLKEKSPIIEFFRLLASLRLRVFALNLGLRCSHQVIKVDGGGSAFYVKRDGPFVVSMKPTILTIHQ